MKKKILIILAIICILALTCSCFVACSKKQDYDVNILSNSDFETLDTAGTTVQSWTASGSTISFPKNTRGDDYDPKLGSYYAKFDVSSAYTYIYQNVELEKNASYEIKAYVKVESITYQDDIGLRFGFETDTEFKGLSVLKATDDEWTEVVYYFTSGVSDSVKFTIGAGSKDVTSVSVVAYVDNVSIKKVESIPTSFTEANTVEVLKLKESTGLSNGGSITFVVLMSIASLLIVGALYIAIKATTPKDGVEVVVNSNKEPSKIDKFFGKYMDVEKVKKALTSNFAIFIYVMLGALLVRFIIIACSYGMQSSVDALESLAQLGKKSGLLSFYALNESSTSTIGNTVLYTFLAEVANWMKIKSASLGYAILMRLPMVIADIVITYLIYTFAAKHKDEKSAAVYSSIYAFVPVMFFFGSFYAATEVIAVAFLVAMFICILEKKYTVSGVLFTFALLFSNYALLALPVLLIFEVYGLIKSSEERVYMAITMILSLAVFYVFGMLMTWSSVKGGDLFVYFKRMYQSFKDSSYLSADSFGMYGMFGQANAKTRNTMFEVLNWLFVVGLSAIPGYLFFKNQNRSDLVLFGAITFILYGTWGAQSTVYVLPMGLALLLLYLVIVPENRLYLCFMALSTLSFLNIAQLASQSGYISGVEGATYTAFASNSAFLIVFSVLTMISTFYLLYVSLDIAMFNQSSMITPLDGNILSETKKLFSQVKPKKLDRKTK
jgi:Gpi18-like mannosyltransferase